MAGNERQSANQVKSQFSMFFMFFKIQLLTDFPSVWPQLIPFLVVSLGSTKVVANPGRPGTSASLTEVPEERPKIAQRFIAGATPKRTKVPQGRQKSLFASWGSVVPAGL
jgi:hypothetical protein